MRKLLLLLALLSSALPLWSQDVPNPDQPGEPAPLPAVPQPGTGGVTPSGNATESDLTSPQAYVDRAEEAIRAENYDYAVGLLEEGQKRFPTAADLYITLAQLYYDQELYPLALEQYRKAEDLEPQSFIVLYDTALTLGHLNREKESISYLERVYDLYPQSPDVASDLGWMYFKTHQLQKGEQVILDAIKRFGSNRNLTMTLGTIYADMYDYAASRKYYLEAIQDALSDGQDYFASVAFYNLSLLEKGFYHFNSALEATTQSLSHGERSPGHLARGELYEMRLDFPRAEQDYQQAYALDDSTPLPKLSLATLYQEFGYLDKALAYAQEVYQATDHTWMFNFGTDRRRHLMEVHQLLGDVYEGLARVDLRTPTPTIVGRIGGFVKSIWHRVLAWYHHKSYRNYAHEVAVAYLDEGSKLNGYWTYYEANEEYPYLARDYLGKARQFETAVIPAAAPSYLVEEGKLNGSVEELRRAAAELDPVWERESLAECYQALVKLLDKRGKHEEAAATAWQLYRLNPGALIQHGIALPVQVEFSGSGGKPAFARRLKRKLRQAGFRLVTANQEQAGLLEVRLVTPDRLVYRLFEKGEYLAGDAVTPREGAQKVDPWYAAAQISRALFRP